MGASYNDGSKRYGSRSETIGGTAYKCENITITRPTNILEERDELGEPSGQVAVPEFVTGTALLQLTSAAVIPVLGATFSDTFVTSIGAETFFLSNIEQPEEHQGIKKVPIQFRKVYNP
jgi:hypothetical protein